MDKIRTLCAVVTTILNIVGLTLFMYVNHIWIFRR